MTPTAGWSAPVVFHRDLNLGELESFGRHLGGFAYPGLTASLIGPLGAGKTTLVRAVLAGAGGDARLVSSPTFVLVHEYSARCAVLHLDVYRLAGPKEFLELGVLEDFPAVFSLIEWADRVAEVLPTDRLEIELETLDEHRRRVFWRGLGPSSAAVALQLEKLV